MPDQEEREPVEVIDDPLEIVPEKPAEPPAPPRRRLALPALKFPRLRLRLPGPSGLAAAGAVLIVLFGFFLVFGHRWIAGQSVFRGVVQEQYYLIGQYAFDRLIEDELRAGRFPLWNHLNALGTPLLGNMLSAVMFPLKAVIYLKDTDGVRDFTLVLRILLAALLAFALAREMKLDRGPAILAAVCFALTGYFKQFVNENYLNADVLLPGMLLLTLRLRRRGHRLDLALLALLTFCVLQNGHPEAAFYCLLLPVAVLAMSGQKKLGPAVFRVGAAFAIGFVLSLPMLLPFVEYWTRGFNFHAPYTGFFHYAARELPALVSPWFFKPAAAGAPFYSPPAFGWPEGVIGLPAYGRTVVPWLCPSLGAAPLFFAAIAAGAPRLLRRTEAALLAYALFFLGVMYGLPGFQALGFLPVFDFSGNFKHPLPAVALAVALLAGRGLSHALERRVSGARVFSVAVGIFIVTLGLGVFQSGSGGLQYFLNARSLAALVAVLAAGAWTATAALPRPRRTGNAPDRLRGPVTVAVAVSACLFCLALDGWHQPMRDIDYLGRVNPKTMALLREQAGIDRVYFSQELFPPNLNILAGLCDLRVMDGVNDRRLVELINRVNGYTRAEGGQYWYREVGYLQPRPDRLSHPLLRLLDVRFAVMTGPLPWDGRLPRIVPEADVVAPDERHVGRARLPLGAGDAPGLLIHPPARVDLLPGDSSEGWQYLRFHPAVSRSAALRQADGVWFNGITLGETERLAYARHLFPRRQPGEIDPGPAQFDLRGGDWVSFSTLPAASADFDQAGLSDLRIGRPEDFDPAPWVEVGRAPNWVYHNPEALPRLFVARAGRAAKESVTLDALAEGKLDPRRVVAINDGGTVAPGSDAAARRQAGEVRGFSYGSQQVTAEVEMAADGWLVLADLCFPGWHAEIDGRPARIRRADFLLRAVALSAGSHQVEFTYRPWAFRLGLWAMVATLLVLPGLRWRGRAGGSPVVKSAPVVDLPGSASGLD